MDRLRVAMAANQRSGRFGALMLVDLDNFKPLNDTHGHDAGDSLLVEVALRMVGCVRATDIVARVGSDEFVVMISDIDNNWNQTREQAIAVAEKIRVALTAPYEISVRASNGDNQIISHHCSASIGVALFPEGDLIGDETLKHADLAMYQAKAKGRNRVAFFDPDPASRSLLDTTT